MLTGYEILQCVGGLINNMNNMQIEQSCEYIKDRCCRDLGCQSKRSTTVKHNQTKALIGIGARAKPNQV